MRRYLLYCFFASSILSLSTACAHAQADAQSLTLLQTALKAFGATSVKDATLTAAGQRTSGTKTESFQATFGVTANGSTQFTLTDSTGPVVETRVPDSLGIWSGAWTDAQGTVHPLAYHNMMTEPDWAFPLFTVMRAVSATAQSSLAISYIGAETFNGAAVQHLRLISAPTEPPRAQALGQSELYLDALTLLPAGLTFNAHPDNNAGIDIPVKILFSSYAIQGGVLLPRHVQQYQNNGLYLDLQIQNVTLNTGLTITVPSAQ